MPTGCRCDRCDGMCRKDDSCPSCELFDCGEALMFAISEDPSQRPTIAMMDVMDKLQAAINSFRAVQIAADRSNGRE